MGTFWEDLSNFFKYSPSQARAKPGTATEQGSLFLDVVNAPSPTTPQEAVITPETPAPEAETPPAAAPTFDIDEVLGAIGGAKQEISNIPQREQLSGDNFFRLGSPEAQAIAAQLGMTTDEAAQYFAGIPISMGYYDASGNWVHESVISQAQELAELRGLEVPSFDDFLTDQGYDMAGTQGKYGALADLLAGGPTDADLDAGREFGAQNLGFADNAAYEDRLGELLTGMENTTFSGELNNTQQRAINREADAMLQESAQMIEAMGMQSTSRALARGNDIIRQVGDFRLQAEMAMEQQNLSKEQLQFEALMSQYQTLQSAGSAEAQRYQDELYRNRMGALQAYASQVAMWTDQYRTEVEGITAHAQTTYQSIMASMSVESHQFEMASQRYEREVESILIDLDLEVQGYALAEADKFQQWSMGMQEDSFEWQKQMQTWSLIISALGTMFDIGTAAIDPTSLLGGL